jgi:hypothetical protein
MPSSGILCRVACVGWILVTLMMEALSSSETFVLTRATQRNVPEDDILHSHRCENLKSYKVNISLPSPEDENIQFPKSFIVSRIPDDGQSPELQ